jgi:hypothetical protein
VRRLPRWLGQVEFSPLGELTFDAVVDLHPADHVVYVDSDGKFHHRIVNGVSHLPSGTYVVVGEDPACGPRPHSGRQAPTR